MPTPTKPANVIEMEGKSHRTKKELRDRKKAEESLLTKKDIVEAKEVKENPKAHKEFLRIRKLLKAIGKNDDLYGSVIGRYCLLAAECSDMREKREMAYRQQEILEERSDEMEIGEYIECQIKLSKTLILYDKQIQAKRKMMLDIEKENVMTIASSLRSVPKKQEEKKSALREALRG